MSFRLKRHLTAGVLLLVPLVVTAAVLRFLFLLLDGWSRPAARSLFGVDVPGLGIPMTVLAVYLVGLLSANLVGKKLLEVFDRLLENLPLVKTVYTASKQLVEAVSPEGRRAFRRVVLVEFPKKGTFALGFVTGEGVGPLKEKALSVYVPTAMNPTSGFLVLVPETEVVKLEMSVADGIKFIISLGSISPEYTPLAPTKVAAGS